MHDDAGQGRDAVEAIVVEREIAGAPVAVYRALTDPAQLDAWWRDLGSGVHWEMDLRPGAHWRASGRDDHVGEYRMDGEIVEAVPPRSLVYTWSETSTARPEPVRSIVRYDVLPSGAGATVRVTHTGVTDPSKHAQYRAGWPGALAALGRFVAGLTPRPSPPPTRADTA